MGDPLPVTPLTTVNRAPAAKYGFSFTLGGANGEPKTTPGSILMALSQIKYSSRYGGSIRLSFKLVDDVGVELIHGRTAWDFRDLTMNIYVAPKIDWVNRGTPYLTNPSEGMAGVEFSTAGAVQYEISGDNAVSNPLVVTATDQDLLTLALGNLATTMRVKLADDAVRFATGFLRSMLKNEIVFGKLVDSLALSDNWVEVKTHTAQAYVTVYWRGGNITASGYNPFESEYEFKVTVNPSVFFLGTMAPSYATLPPQAIKLTGQDMSYAIPLVTWKPADLESWLAEDAPHSLWGIRTAYTIIEQSPVETGNSRSTTAIGSMECCRPSLARPT